MTTDWKALCAELHAAFNTYAVDEVHHALLERARAALAQPEPEGPTKAELQQVFDDQSGYINADTLVSLIEQHYAEQGAMLDQAMQAAETLRDCWLERTGLTIEDDPFVEDAFSTIQSIRSERLRSEP